MVRIVIVDDHPSTRDGLITRIQIEPDLDVCGEAADVDEALDVIERERPDLVIVDISLKTGNGIDLIKQVSDRYKFVRMLVWSMYDESLYAERSLRAGAMGYINKENVTDTIVEAIRTVMQGDVFLSPNMSAKMLNRAIHGKPDVGRAPIDALSDRELQTFGLIGKGLSTADIAQKMELSPKTIETYRARIKEKLELRNMAQLTREATLWVLENS